MEQSNNTFRYHPLHQFRPEFRILGLEPSQDPRTPIYCTLHYCYLDVFPAPKYSAVSYAWGDPKITNQIFLDGQPFQVTVNLVAALRAIRHRRDTLAIWADAVCINQSDSSEREQQVALMSRIYTSADMVFLWVGARDSDIRDALPILTYDYDGDAYRCVDELRSMIPSNGKRRDELVRQLVVHIFEAPVWTRMWIIQELSLAEHTQILCGSFSIPWRTVALVAKILLSNDFSPREICILGTRGSSTIYALTLYWLRSNRGGPPRDLLRAWYNFGYCQCSDPRDKVYALLNIVSHNLGIMPDYKVSVTKLFCKVTRNHILANQNLRILSCKWQYSTTGKDPAPGPRLKGKGPKISSQALGRPTGQPLPSWALDFEAIGGNDTTPLFNFRFDNLDDKPEIPWNRQSTQLLTNFGDPCLALIGISIDKLAWVSPSARKLLPSEELEKFMRESEEVGKMANENSLARKYQSKEIAEEAYWKTLSCNRFQIMGGDFPRSEDLSSDVQGIWRRVLRTWIYNTRNNNGRKSASPLKSKGLFKRHKGPTSIVHIEPNDTSATPEEVSTFKDHIKNFTRGYSFAITLKGSFALVPDSSRPGDVVAGFCGGFGAHILRQVDRRNEDVVSLVGPAYVHELDLKEEWEGRQRGMERAFQMI